MGELYDTRIGKWLSLGRIQSAPLTATFFTLFYGISGSDVLSAEGVTLFIATVLAHWGVFAHNDVVDAIPDRQKDTYHYKPVAAGYIHSMWATAAASIAAAVSIILVYTISPATGTVAFFSLIILGYLYNKTSKSTKYAPFILMVWGGTSVFVCAYIGGGVSFYTYFLAVGIACLSGWLIFFGDVLDIEYEEDSILELTGYTIVHTRGDYKMYELSNKSKLVADLLVAGEFMIILGTFGLPNAEWDVLDIFAVAIAIVVFSVGLINSTYLTGFRAINRDMMKRDYFTHMAAVTMATLICSTLFVDYRITGVLLLTSVTWQLSAQKVQYGKWVFFP